MLSSFFNDADELEKTLAIGLYHRFKKEKDFDERPEYKEEDPYAFEHFVAKVLETQFGGKAVPTKKSGERGIDIIHERAEGLYLGQVKCELGKVNYVPAAVLHSQMVKQNAVGGYVIAVRDFEQSAIDHVVGININLIDGKQLVHMWLNPQAAYDKTFIERLLDAIGEEIRKHFSQLKNTIATFVREKLPFNLEKMK